MNASTTGKFPSSTKPVKSSSDDLVFVANSFYPFPQLAQGDSYAVILEKI
jgi:hypothetical protein